MLLYFLDYTCYLVLIPLFKELLMHLIVLFIRSSNNDKILIWITVITLSHCLLLIKVQRLLTSMGIFSLTSKIWTLPYENIQIYS